MIDIKHCGADALSSLNMMALNTFIVKDISFSVMHLKGVIQMPEMLNDIIQCKLQRVKTILGTSRSRM